jgi:hypothetical protein
MMIDNMQHDPKGNTDAHCLISIEADEPQQPQTDNFVPRNMRLLVKEPVPMLNKYGMTDKLPARRKNTKKFQDGPSLLKTTS